MNDSIENTKIAGNKSNTESNLPVPLDAFHYCEVLFYGYLLNRLESLETATQANQNAMADLDKTVHQLENCFKQCIDIVCACQKQTAELLNNNIERHALNPAIETVVSLCNEIQKLKSVSEKNAAKIADEANMSLQLAQDRLAYLGIERIMPLAEDCFDSAKHAICGYEEIANKDLHGKISKTVTLGIFYRGKVITPARVKIYRYCENKSKTLI